MPQWGIAPFAAGRSGFFMTIEIFVDESGEIQSESVGEIWGQGDGTLVEEKL